MTCILFHHPKEPKNSCKLKEFTLAIQLQSFDWNPEIWNQAATGLYRRARRHV